ncbi:conserved hypothetical protein [Vibrio nigripulchritudo MADA3029]|uniref:hypothetical protein n=1 Tax=Vibrio nigripulchritudo TaxID=28173 RepID=UPI0003B1A51B|nr:hypothetical protein [Vibrio nigripulchritudo]CCN38748.1 conserved hypothetical protein [Vibrio nigripulchritudo AM115]CCN45055.1 conserved hypothetical protein [Vibrio nigripulchritudo FTn2]CCN50900.1 conserved hypothetical protein [Vibrio nigripulchritudo MADA3020]CCN56758.1 conserved hypothetical protein [Vibrio nigripulchritudo MADA3021]CCN62615.1 conserved hypothetical protein [Vibrio nigripulchritudo MADA3029]
MTAEKFVQTISNVNYNKGVFSLYFVGQNQARMANGVMAESEDELELKQVVHMPAAGFMYMMSTIGSMLEDTRMKAELEKLVASGFLPALDPESNEVETEATSESSDEKTEPFSPN